ncbi:MAG: restriction endonuclease subunit R, partial [Armatimonadota bacterium]|nr:restriction endonuclease subunit R [Armatimonadota bacterium]
LSEYIQAGYGKHIALLKQELRAFRDKEDYNSEEKRKVVLKALMMLAYVHKVHKSIRVSVASSLYHRPLMLVLVNSVHTEDADLELFFRELERIAREGVSEELWQVAKDELEQELKDKPPFVFEDEQLQLNEDVWQLLTLEDLLQSGFNSDAHGEIEVLVRPSNRQELAFKLMSADRPFALIKIGDISGWLKEKLTGYEINERFEDESYFARLNEEDSDINILMGSRTFYEGWDSNRPNVICYINIGVGEDARKFILQSVGRGVRIEPIRNKRKRILPLYNAGEVDKELFDQLKNKVQPIETLFIFGTNRRALQTVIEGLKQEQVKTGEHQLSLFEVNPEVRKENIRLLIPVYKLAEQLLAERKEVAKFEVDPNELEDMRKFVEATDDRVLMMLCDAEPTKLRLLRKSLTEPDKFYLKNGKRHGNMLRLLRRVLDWWAIVPEEFDRLKELEDEIRHFRHITVMLKDIRALEDKLTRVKDYRDPSAEQQRLIEQLQRKEISPEQFKQDYDKTTQMVKEERFEYEGKRIVIKHIAQHYYLPVVLSEDERVDYIRHIIKTPSEVNFINALERYLNQPNNRFREFDWWFFSKLDESLDEVYLPYYDPKANRIARFKPDFIFWLKKGNHYFIVFVDPKGTEHIDWQRKVDGYRAVFEDNGLPKVLPHNGWEVTVRLFLYTEDVSRSPEIYRQFWFDSFDGMIDSFDREGRH